VELRARVAQLQDDLAAANQELEALAHSVSHDLRAPLRAVQGFSQIALDECGDAMPGNGREYLTRVTSASRRMSSQIDSLLKLSKVGRAPMQRVPLDVSALTLEVWRRLKQAEPARDVPLTVVDGLRATADRRLLETALEQLLDNARKFTARTLFPEVEVGLNEIGGEPAFFVRDNGAGFEQAYAGRLFAPFQRLHSDRDFQGLGIGLAIVHRVVRRHGGRVWATGAPGAGATISFTLPEPWRAR
jgi:light-regulated signal transduction histidine kinase (bacteriophytochrome)